LALWARSNSQRLKFGLLLGTRHRVAMVTQKPAGNR
jgi:hypothetical protein